MEGREHVAEDEADRQLGKLQRAVTKLVGAIACTIYIIDKSESNTHWSSTLVAIQAVKESMSEESWRRLDRQLFKTEEAVEALLLEQIPREIINQRRSR